MAADRTQSLLALAEVREGTVTLARSVAERVATAKRCGCGATYTREAWRELRRCGYQELAREPEGTGVDVFELRDCSRCHSTISIMVEPAEVDASAPYARIA